MEFAKKIVSIAFSYGGKVFGTYVIDLLRLDYNYSPEIEIMFEYKYGDSDNINKVSKRVDEFVDMLGIVYEIKVILEEWVNGFEPCDVVVEVKDTIGDKIKVKISYVDSKSFTARIDFDVNTLVMSKNGLEISSFYRQEKEKLRQNENILNILQKIQRILLFGA